MGSERVEVCEGLFDPQSIEVEDNPEGVHKLIMKSLSKLGDENLKSIFFDNIVVTGGSTQLPGFKERLQQEIKDSAIHSYKYKVHSITEPHLAAWRGGSVLADISTFPDTYEKYLFVY